MPTPAFFFFKGKSRSCVCVNEPPQCEHRAVFVRSAELSPAGLLLYARWRPYCPTRSSYRIPHANPSHANPSHDSHSTISTAAVSADQAHACPAELVLSVSLLAVHYRLISLALCPIQQQKWESLLASPLPFCTRDSLQSALRPWSNGRWEVRARLLMNPFNYRSSVIRCELG